MIIRHLVCNGMSRISGGSVTEHQPAPAQISQLAEPVKTRWAKFSTAVKEVSKKLWRFLEWFIEQVLVPILPLAVARGVDRLFHYQSVGLHDEKILIYAFLLPLLYVREVSAGAVRTLIAIASGIGLVLFALTYAYQHVPSAPDLNGPYEAGFWLCVLYVSLASTYELIKIFRPRQVS